MISTKKKRIGKLALVSLLIFVLVGNILAYFTDGDTATNTFNVGKVSIDLKEPNWSGSFQTQYYLKKR